VSFGLPKLNFGLPKLNFGAPKFDLRFDQKLSFGPPSFRSQCSARFIVFSASGQKAEARTSRI